MLRLCNCLRALLRIRRSADFVFGIFLKGDEFRRTDAIVNAETPLRSLLFADLLVLL